LGVTHHFSDAVCLLPVALALVKVDELNQVLLRLVTLALLVQSKCELEDQIRVVRRPPDARPQCLYLIVTLAD
jgi:hypothetical protein